MGSIRDVLERHPDLEPLIPAMGYGSAQMEDLRETLEAVDADMVLSATPIDLERLLRLDVPVARIRYELVQMTGRPLAEILEPIVRSAREPS